MTIVRRDVKFDEEKVMWCSLERVLQIPLEEVILASKEEPQEVVEQPKVEEQRLEITTQAEPSKEGRKRMREAKRLV